MVLDCPKVDPAFASDFRIRERLYGILYNDSVPPFLCPSSGHTAHAPTFQHGRLSARRSCWHCGYTPFSLSFMLLTCLQGLPSSLQPL